MEVLHANEEQYKNLNGYRKDFSLLEFTKDALDRWIAGIGVLKDPNFAEIHDQLNELERVEYLPITEEEEEI
jgi:hypothetical protein